MKSLVGPIIKSLIFIVVTVIATTLLAVTIINGTVSGGRHYNAIFTDVTSLNVGDDIRMAGVRVGQVTSIKIHDHREAQVGFTVESDIRLARTAAATIRYRNLIGQRYVAITQGDGSLADPLPANATLGPRPVRARPDHAVQRLPPIVQGAQSRRRQHAVLRDHPGVPRRRPHRGQPVHRTASLTSALAGRDQVIGQVIDNLNTVLVDVNARSGELTRLIGHAAGLRQRPGAGSGRTRHVADLHIEPVDECGQPVVEQDGTVNALQ